MKAIPITNRFWNKVNKTETCWVWTAGKNADGYGYISESKNGVKRHFRAHRLAYEFSHGLIPVGLELDHLCRNRACVNPAHLEVVTSKINVLRGEGLAAKNKNKTHCPKGHEYTQENTYIIANKRVCKICNRKRALQRYYKTRKTIKNE